MQQYFGLTLAKRRNGQTTGTCMMAKGSFSRGQVTQGQDSGLLLAMLCLVQWNRWHTTHPSMTHLCPLLAPGPSLEGGLTGSQSHWNYKVKTVIFVEFKTNSVRIDLKKKSSLKPKTTIEIIFPNDSKLSQIKINCIQVPI